MRLEAAVAHRRGELLDTLGQLRTALEGQFDWREWVRRHPLWAVGIVGFVGYRLGRRR